MKRERIMSEKNEWLEDSYVKKWFGKIKSPNTVKNYSMSFPMWLEFVKMSPTEQIEKRIKDLQSGDIQTIAWFEDRVIEYKNALVTKEFRSATIHSYLMSILSFFSKNRLKLSFSAGDLGESGKKG